MQDRLMVIRLIRIGRHQVQEYGKNLLGEFAPLAAAVFENLMESVLQIVIGSLLALRQPERHGDLLVLRQLLTHVHEREEHAVFQQEPAVHQRRHAGTLALALFALHAAPVRVISALRDLISCLANAVFIREAGRDGISLAVLLHAVRAHAVQQIEDTGGIAVDEGCRHADALFRSGEQLAHRVPLPAVCSVLVQLVCKQATYFPAVFFLDVGAEREAAAGAARDGMAARVLDQFAELLPCRSSFAGVQREVRKPAVHIAKMADTHPFALFFCGSSCPEDSSAAFALAVGAGLRPEILRRSVYQRPLAAVQERHLDHAAAVRAGKALLVCIPMDCRAAHIAVPRGLLGDHREYRAAAAGIFRVECVEVRRRLHNSRQRTRDGLIQLAYPFAGHVGWAEDEVQAFPMLLQEVCLQGEAADLRFS